MSQIKINITFEFFSFQKAIISQIIKSCIRETLAAEGVPVGCEINVLVTDDIGIRGINLATRDIDAPTDVLSFPMFEMTAGELPVTWEGLTDPDSGLCPLGDMAISVERAKAQAKEFGHSLRREIGYLTIHSMLHLLGYDHLDEGEDKKKMREREEFIASRIPGMQR